jgi:hypothetical protein
MAIQFQTQNFGVSFTTAYGKVTSLTYDGFTEQASATMHTWATKAARQSNESPISASSVSFPVDLISTSNLVQQAYAALKARPEFGGAVDV